MDREGRELDVIEHDVDRVADERRGDVEIREHVLLDLVGFAVELARAGTVRLQEGQLQLREGLENGRCGHVVVSYVRVCRSKASGAG